MGKYFTDKYQKNKTPASFHPFEEKYNETPKRPVLKVLDTINHLPDSEWLL